MTPELKEWCAGFSVGAIERAYRLGYEMGGAEAVACNPRTTKVDGTFSSVHVADIIELFERHGFDAVASWINDDRVRITGKRVREVETRRGEDYGCNHS